MAKLGLSLGLGILLSLPVLAEMSPQQQLVSMSHAFKEQNYQGIFIYGQAGKVESLSIAHVMESGIERERLVHLDGPVREIVRNGHSVTCVHPGDQILRLEHSIPAGPFAQVFNKDVAKLSGFYNLQPKGLGRVAGHMANVLYIIPKDAYRYGYRLWLDKESNLLLKSEMVDQSGRILERFQFTQLDIGLKAEDVVLQASPLTKGHQVAQHHVPASANAVTGKTATGKPAGLSWHLAWMPKGYTKASQENRYLGQQQSGKKQMYTDGMSAFTVFVEKRGQGNLPAGISRRGATVAVVRHSQFNGGQQVITVVGEVPSMTAEKIAASVQLMP